MKHHGTRNPNVGLDKLGVNECEQVFWNLPPAELVEHTLAAGLGTLTDTGALAIDTGEFTGRSPKDRFFVKDAITADSVDWNAINQPIEGKYFDQLWEKMTEYIANKTLYARDAIACADDNHRLNVRVVTEEAWQNIFVNNLFIRPTQEALASFTPDWHILAIPTFKADPSVDGTRQHNFTIVDFTKQIILIGGSAYTGEIKKGIFTVLNYLLPHKKGVLSMHCSANVGQEGDTAIFFGLSGTGKTTLSADPDRKLIGDDEHGWTANSVFNFEGGCYAKVINLSKESEPEIYEAIKFGSLIENTRYFDGTRCVNYEDSSVTENTRVSYPIDHIGNALVPSVGNVPKNIFFLTCDAFGVLPPISKLTPEQAMYQFISGYTAKVAGTEAGITEPQVVFSACFGAPFLPLHPTQYADMLGKKMQEQNVKVWLINTGWSGGPYGIGKRMKLGYTRAMIAAALEGQLDEVAYHEDPIFGLAMPSVCPNVPDNVLNPIDTWADKEAYIEKANELAKRFRDNFSQYANKASEAILSAAPKQVSMSEY